MIWTHILFDLDGTLTDPGVGITNSVAYALERYGVSVPDRRTLYPFIGPPLVESFQRYYAFSPADARAAVDVYREYFADRGIFENELYSGIPALLGRLRAAGCRLVMATSKPEAFAVRIAEHFGIAAYFDCIAGAALDETRTQKWEVIEYALARCGVSDRARVLMVGDREHDVRGAARCGLSCLGVTYGYGSAEELNSAGACAVVPTVEAVGDWICDIERGAPPALEDLKRDYVRLLIREGVNLQPGQRLVLTAAVDQADIARACAEAAYDAESAEVILNWSDDALTRMKYLRADGAVFDACPPWKALLYNSLAEEGAAWLFLDSDDPENLKGVDPDRIRRSQIASGAALKTFRTLETANGFPWCIAAVPSAAWAKLVFPDLTEPAAVQALWREILKAARCTRLTAVADWHAHSDELHRRVEILNDYAFRFLHYQNSLGTDLTVELPEGHFWAGGAEACGKTGVPFSANIPSEEVFTLPKRDGVNGTVVASKPLSLNGNIVEGIRFTLKDGEIVALHADKGEDILRDATQVDEGARYFGEVALVPCASPISESGLLFYNTLFDENASCHFAFGDAYPCIRDAEGLDEAGLLARGVNRSIAHVDFMVGTPDLSITGTTRDGRTVPVFIDGNFAF